VLLQQHTAQVCATDGRSLTAASEILVTVPAYETIRRVRKELWEELYPV
jgi:hypothetical protein